MESPSNLLEIVNPGRLYTVEKGVNVDMFRQMLDESVCNIQMTWTSFTALKKDQTCGNNE